MHERLASASSIARKVGTEFRALCRQTSLEARAFFGSDKAGQILLAEHQEAVREETFSRERFRHMLLNHSDLECTSEQWFLLGLVDRDPHPEHKITIIECNHPEYQAKYGISKTDLGWTPPNFRPEKLAI